jgi:hypothetical protein
MVERNKEDHSFLKRGKSSLYLSRKSIRKSVEIVAHHPPPAAVVHLSQSLNLNRNLRERGDTIGIIIIIITEPVEGMIVGREDSIRVVEEMNEREVEADEIMFKNN